MKQFNGLVRAKFEFSDVATTEALFAWVESGPDHQLVAQVMHRPKHLLANGDPVLGYRLDASTAIQQ